MALKISVRTVLPTRETGDVIVVGSPRLATSKKIPPKSVLAGIDRALGGALGRLIKREDFKGKRDHQITLSTLGRAKADRLIVIGLEGRDGAGDIRTFAAKAARAANAYKAKRLVFAVPEHAEHRLGEIAEGLELGAYRFTKYFTEHSDRRPTAELAQVAICLSGKVPADAKEQIEFGQNHAAGVNLARDLSNEPPNVLYPDALAAAAVAACKTAGVKAQVFDYKEVQRRGMKLLEAVGRGSERKPCMVHMSWTPAGAKKKLVFVGKGITFDSGGLSIKPAAGMGEMKHDMSGAANVVGLMTIIGKMRPNIEVHGIIACAENMPDGGAYRPGDIFGSLDGKTVEIVNTDAEGRLVLADALAYARTLGPDLIVDNATLTGACVVALGNGCSGWYASDEETAAQFDAAVKASGELMWRLPLLEELKDQLRSDHADLKHTGDRWGGSISAAMFLRQFVSGTSWIHCDIAGPAMGDRVRGWDPKGGTGHAVLTFLELVRGHATGTAPAAGTSNGTKPSRAEGAPAQSEGEGARQPQGRTVAKKRARRS